MAVVGIGTDLARIERFRKFLQPDNKVLERIFSEDERSYALAMKDPAPHLAARFAAKEAFLKALGTGLRDGLSWQQVLVVRDQLGCPSLQLSGRAAEMLAERNVCSTHLSYSHDGDYAVATVVLES
ncbi:holo-[acyl-carrier protein] synthase [Malonomonas rubra DSM 5091]|uniref:Holo-[acyl-carrier-protein] synthase n=1 Tax=Malonomonas rubra DSM 5091 TaxID=1122189 RepID=A0A1M6F0N5_MALRU|nr:holo-ACP synthase [Malonomonas rubra]SHI91288.1 holo-[acyl-carrier protein] synthase [Malonomonas rubra DSM 5091]